MANKISPAKKASAKNSSMKKALPWIIVGVVVVVIGILLFKPSANSDGAGFRNVDSAGLLEAQKNGAEIVDVRTQGEYEMGHIKGAVNVPVDQLQSTAQSWDRNADYVLYCASGERSAAGQNAMQSMGFKSVANLTGGIASWSGPLEKGTTTSQQTIPTSGKAVLIDFYTPT
jgi:rhodanese-related sulfurtransferase